MTTSPPEADSAITDRVPPISFARWALGVLVPLATWEVGIAVFLSHDVFFDYLLFGTPLVYAAIYCGRHALAIGLPVIRALAIAAFTPAAAFTVYAFPVMGGSLYPLYWIGARPGPIGFPLAFCAACAAYGLLLALVQWISHSFPDRGRWAWLKVQAVGAILGGTTFGVAILATTSWQAPAVGPGLVLLPYLWPIFGALPHLATTWPAHTPLGSAHASRPGQFGIRNPYARMTAALLAGYLLVVGGRIVVDGPSWDSVLWLKSDIGW